MAARAPEGDGAAAAAAAARAVLARLTDPAAGLATALERAIVLTTLAPGAALFEASPFAALPELADGGADAASGGSRRLGRRVAGAPAPPRARRQPVRGTATVSAQVAPPTAPGETIPQRDPAARAPEPDRAAMEERVVFPVA